jgi:hypothetical protein
MAKVILIYPCNNVEPPILPDYKKSPRLQFLDTGILNFDLNIQADLLLMKDLSEAYKTSIILHIIIIIFQLLQLILFDLLLGSGQNAIISRGGFAHCSRKITDSY